MNGKTPYRTTFDKLNNNIDDNPSPIVTKEIICSSLNNEYKLCLMEIGNDIYHPKCVEIKKIMKLLECNKN
jgi:hypothetical protein